MELDALPIELARAITAFLTVEELVRLVAWAAPSPSWLEHFRPSAELLDASVRDSALCMRHSRRHHSAVLVAQAPGIQLLPASNVCIAAPLPRLCPYHHHGVRRLLLLDDAYAPIASRKLVPSEALQHRILTHGGSGATTESATIEIVSALERRGQLNRFECARTLCDALSQRRHELVRRLLQLRYGAMAMATLVSWVPRAWRNKVLLAACAYDRDPVRLQLIRELCALRASSRMVRVRTPATCRVADPNHDLKHAVALAAASGSIEIVELLLHASFTGDPVSVGQVAQHALNAAAAAGNTHIVRHLLAHDANLEWSSKLLDARDALVHACEQGHSDVVHLLLATTSLGASATALSPMLAASSVLFAAVTGRNAAILAAVLSDERVNAWDSLALHHAARDGNVRAFEALVVHPSCRQIDLEAALRTAARADQPSVGVTAILEHLFRICASSCGGDDASWELVDLACAYGDIQLVEYVLQAAFSANSSRKYWRPLVTSARHGHTDIVRLLLASPLVTHHEDGDCDEGEVGEALVAACHHGHGEVATLLLPRVSAPLMRRLRVLEAAAAAASTDVLEILLSDQGDLVQRHCDMEAALQYACAHARTASVRLLLAHPLVRFSDGLALQFAATTGNVELVSLLLADARVDASYDLEAALVDAAREGHVAIVHLLLRDPRLQLSSGACVHEAAHRGHFAVTKLLLDAEPIWTVNRNGLDLELAYTNAARSGHYAVVFLLLDDVRVPLPRNVALTRITDLPRRMGDTRWCRFLRRFLGHARVDPGANGGELLMDACMRGRRGLVMELLRCGRVNYVGALEALTSALRTKHVHMPQLPQTKRSQRFEAIARDLETHLHSMH